MRSALEHGRNGGISFVNRSTVIRLIHILTALFFDPLGYERVVETQLLALASFFFSRENV